MRSVDRESLLSSKLWVPRQAAKPASEVPGAGSGVGKRNYNRVTVAKSIGSLFCVALFVSAAGCAHHNADLSRPSSQDNFGVQMAQMSLWREAMFRFRRAVELNPSDAMAHNNLAVAYEANGDFENAAKEYREALKLDRGNSYIQKNYSRYTEFMSRSKKKPGKNVPKTAAAKNGEKPKSPSLPPDQMAPAPPAQIPGTSALPPGIVPPPEVPMPGAGVVPRKPPTGGVE
jgi:tetratricopeptide (TPR) repeat protein